MTHDVTPPAQAIRVEDVGRVYWLAGVPVRAHTPAGQAVLAAAYRRRQRPSCPCTPGGVPMYVARVGARFLIKRMPGTGPLHGPDCAAATADPSFDPRRTPVLAAAGGGADSSATVRLAVPLVVAEHAAYGHGVDARPTELLSVGGRLADLRDLLEYLWRQCGLDSWSPGMAGRRHWGLIAWLLRRASATVHTDDGPLTDHLYIPEVFHLRSKTEIAARRVAAWQPATVHAGGAHRAMVLLGEVKAVKPARYGHKLVLRNVPDAPLYLGQDLYRSVCDRFTPQIDGLSAGGSGHLVVAATFTVGRGGSATAHELALMSTTAQWLPYQDTSSRRLIDHLVDQHHRFSVTSDLHGPHEPAGPTVVSTPQRYARMGVTDPSG